MDGNIASKAGGMEHRSIQRHKVNGSESPQQTENQTMSQNKVVLRCADDLESTGELSQAFNRWLRRLIS